jgi:hypothetical protein
MVADPLVSIVGTLFAVCTEEPGMTATRTEPDNLQRVAEFASRRVPPKKCEAKKNLARPCLRALPDIALATLFSDWFDEIAVTLLPHSSHL